VVVVDREDGVEVVVQEELALGAGGGERGRGGARAGARRGGRGRGRGGLRNRSADAEGVDQAAGGGGATCQVACGEQFDEHVVRAKEANSVRSTSVEVVAERGSGAPRKDGKESARLAEEGVGDVVAQASGSSVLVEAAGPSDGGAELEEVVTREGKRLADGGV
jgi:hypothetical protein